MAPIQLPTNKPQVISSAQLHALLNRYEDQLQVCDNQRKTLEDAYTNGHPIKDLFAPVEAFRPVNGMIPKNLTKSNALLLPAELRDAMVNLTVGDMSLVVAALKHRIDRIGVIIDNARLSCNDPTQTWDEVQSELAGVSKTTCDGGDGVYLSFADIVLGSSQDDMCKGLAAFNIASKPKETWQKAVPKDFGLYIGAPHAGRQSIADKPAQSENSITGSLKRRDPTTAKKYGEYHGGFHPEELMNKGALTPSTQSSNVSPTCTLTTEIHPIFARERFIECPQEVYDVLKPSLRLATLILQHRATSRYWHTAAFGPRSTCALPESNKEALHIAAELPWTATNATAFASRLKALTNHCTIQFNLSDPDDANYGCCITKQQTKRFVLPLDKTPTRAALIHLSFDFYTTAVRLARTRHPDPHMLLRFQFLFAVVLLHEMAHWMEATHASTFLGEPYIGTDTFNEAGFAFEERTFGGRICAVNHRMDCAYGVCMAVYDADGKGLAFYSMPMDYIVRVQQQSTWDDPALLLDPVKVLHIPRDGARSFGPCTFSLLAWDDEEEIGGMMDVVDTGFVVGRKKDCGKAVHSNLLRVMSGRIGKAREKEAVGPRKVDLRRKRFLSNLVEEAEEM